MFAKYEKRTSATEPVWVAKWLRLKNAPHWHDELEIVYSEEGECTIKTESAEFPLVKGECALIESGAIHTIKGSKDSVIITVHIAASLVGAIVGKERLENSKLTKTPDMPSFYRFIKEEITEKRPYHSAVTGAYTARLIAEIFRAEKKTDRSGEENPRHEFLKNVITEIENNYKFLRFEDVCQKFGYSPSHFSRLFTSLTGVPFSKYLNRLKVSHAVELLNGNEKTSVTEVALNCGFSCIRTFNRCFKEATGYTPKTLPKDFRFPLRPVRLHREPIDPTEKDSVLL